VVAAPLGSRGRTLRYFFFALILAFSLQWQFDVFFHQMPRDKNTYSVDGSDQDGQRFLVCNLLTKYHNWETLEDASWVLNQSPEGGFIHTLRDLDTFAPFRRIYWPAWSGLPLKNVPPKAKGAVLILGDDTGKAFQDWIDYYYPGAHSGTVSNNFQDIQIRFWEITPDQVQQALNLHPGPPLTGLILGWYDPQNRLLGQRQIPTLATGYLLNDYFRDDPDEPAFPWNKVVSFKAKGRLNCKGMAWVLKTNGRVDGSFGGKPFHCVGLATGSQFNLPLPAQGWVPFEFRYTLPQPGVFDLGFSQRSPTGWDLVPASQLKP
ncbi:MAG TPA: hypothetical protein VJ873_05385, partial [bacterium]|nr:hypothetical protein [bacterium]